MPARYIRHSQEPSTRDMKATGEKLKEALTTYLSVLQENRHHVHGHSVYTGPKGLAVMHHSLSSLPTIRSIVHAKALDYIRDTISLSTGSMQKLFEQSIDPARVAFLETQTGLCVLLISHIDDQYLSDQPFSFCVDQLQNVIHTISRQEDDSDDGTEVLYGRAGFLYGLLLMKNAVSSRGWTRSNGSSIPAQEKLLHLVSNDSLSVVIRSIIKRGEIGASSYALGVVPIRERDTLTPPLMWSWHGKRYLGAAHGVVGILHVLLLCPITLIQDYLPEILETVEWLITRQDSEGNWPIKAPPLSQSSIDPSSRSEEHNELVQWCHGAPGSLLLLSRVIRLNHLDATTFSIAPSTQARIASALRAGASIVYRHGLLRKGIGLCHGVAGSIYALLAVADAMALSPDDGNKRDSQYYFCRAAHLAELATEFETFTREGRMKVPDRPLSLFEGLAGMCCAWGEICDRIERASDESKNWYRHRSGMPGYDDI
ncbi:hypothetical protein PQX77_005928 [Marasmius sp. AFHP31]|nr:hypothetical protein PQX77_005928 [Marasmius sp. AFHP31]